MAEVRMSLKEYDTLKGKADLVDRLVKARHESWNNKIILSVDASLIEEQILAAVQTVLDSVEGNFHMEGNLQQPIELSQYYLCWQADQIGEEEDAK